MGGFFSQRGKLYVVHHLQAYKDLQSWEETRNAAWRKRGWDQNVYYSPPGATHGVSDHDPFEDFTSSVMLAAASTSFLSSLRAAMDGGAPSSAVLVLSQI